MPRTTFVRILLPLMGLVVLLLATGCAHPCEYVTIEKTLTLAQADGTQGTAVEKSHYLTYVPYRWYTPVLKPVAAVTLAAPIYSACRPHPHADGRIGAGDRTRDFISWFNPFSGVPTGPRTIALQGRPERVESAAESKQQP